MLPMQRHDAECDACVPACTVGQPGFLRATRAVRVLDFLGSILLSTTLGPGSISLNVRFWACAVKRRRFSSGCKAHPATAPAGSNRSNYGGNEMVEAFG